MAKRSHITIRGLYGGIPSDWLIQGRRLIDYGVNAIWIGSGSLNAADITLLKSHGAKVFAEFNSMHEADYVAAHPDAAPVGFDGATCPPPDGWQGLCPTHPGYRRNRMAAFRAVLQNYEIDGIWLDYHHSQASWEQAVPNMPDSCFCERCLAQFAADSRLTIAEASASERSRLLLGELRKEWVGWRCGVFTDWVREYRNIVDTVRPGALLGTFHCPWNETDFGGALVVKLAIDLKGQAPYLDVLSIMPYHARFAHAHDPAWISRQVEWLSEYLGIEGTSGERLQIWPIVQLSDWGDKVPARQVATVLDHGTRLPATGVTVFAWASLRNQPRKLAEISRFYRSISE